MRIDDLTIGSKWEVKQSYIDRHKSQGGISVIVRLDSNSGNVEYLYTSPDGHYKNRLCSCGVTGFLDMYGELCVNAKIFSLKEKIEKIKNSL